MMLNVGILGMLLILFAYFWLLSGNITAKSPKYLFINFLAGLLLSIYAFSLHSVPFILINSVFALGSLVKCLQRTFYR